MIKQEFKHGNNVIEIQTAESIHDMEKNDLSQGQYHKFSVNGRPVSTYKGMLDHIIEENRKKGQKVIPSNVEEIRKKMLDKNIKGLSEMIESLKAKYKGMGVHESALKRIEDYAAKINGSGVRVKE